MVEVFSDDTDPLVLNALLYSGDKDRLRNFLDAAKKIVAPNKKNHNHSGNINRTNIFEQINGEPQGYFHDGSWWTM